MRLPFVLRSTMESELEAQLGRYNALMGTKERLIKAQEGMIVALSADIARLRQADALTAVALSDRADQLARLREHFDATCKAKDEAYETIHAAWYAADLRNVELLCELDALRPPPESGRLDIGPLDSVAVTIDPRGMYCSLPGVRSDDASDDPRENLSLPMGLKPCDNSAPSKPNG